MGSHPRRWPGQDERGRVPDSLCGLLRIFPIAAVRKDHPAAPDLAGTPAVSLRRSPPLATTSSSRLQRLAVLFSPLFLINHNSFRCVLLMLLIVEFLNPCPGCSRFIRAASSAGVSCGYLRR